MRKRVIVLVIVSLLIILPLTILNGKRVAEQRKFDEENAEYVEAVHNEEKERLAQEAISRSFAVEHCVQSGETIESIADEYDSSIEKILEENKLDSSELYEGMFIIIPGE